MDEKKAQLKRSFKPSNIWALALGAIIGFGCFVLPGDWISKAGPLGAVIGISIGGGIMLLIGRSYGFMVRNIPVAGGEFAYAYKSFGRDNAFICGWMLSLGYLCIIPLNSTALPILGQYLAPAAFTKCYMYSIADYKVYLPQVALASAAILYFGYLNYRGAQAVGSIQLLMVLLLVGAVVLLGGGSMLYSGTRAENFLPLFAPDKSPIVAILAIVAIAPWAFVGFDTIPQAAEEFDFPPDKAFKLIVMAIVLGAAMYIIVLLSTACVASWNPFVTKELADGSWPTGTAMRMCMGKFGIFVLMVGVVMAICTGINGFYMATSRLMFSMSRAKILPAWFSKIHPVHKTPSNAVLFAMLVSLLAPWFGRNVILWVVDMSATGTAVGYGYTCLSAWLLSRAFADQKARFTHLLAAIFSAIFLVLLCVPGMPAFMAVPSWVALAVWMVLGIIFYLMQVKEYRSMSTAQLDHLILDVPEPYK